MRKCKLCQKSIEHKHANAKFCNQKCKDKYHNITNPRGYFAQSADDDDNIGHIFESGYFGHGQE